MDQNDHIFNSRISENLKISNPKATTGELYKALEKVDLSNFVYQLSNKIDTWIGEYG